jgi:PAS domain S-box-containing protein
MAELDAALASRRAHLEQRLRIVRPDGGVREILIRARLACDARGEPVRLSGVAVDLTGETPHSAAASSDSRPLADAMPHLVWTTDPAGEVDYCNSRIADYHPSARLGGVGYRWQALVHPDEMAATGAAWQEALRGQSTYTFEHRLLMADGSWRWHLSRAVPAQDAHGCVVGWYGTATDIHALKSAELSATNELEQLEAIYRAAPVGLCLLDRELRFVRVNEALADINGRPVSEHLGRSVWEIVPAMRPAAEPALAQVLATGRPAINIEIASETPREPGVERRWLEQFYPIAGHDGTVTHVGVICEEVTERRRIEAALRESEGRLRAVFAGIDEGFCLCEMIVDDDGRAVDYRFLEVNPLFEAMTGLKDAVGRTALELLPDLERHWVDTYARVGLGRESLRFENGSAVMGRWFDVFATPVEPHGRFAIVFKDTTAGKAAADALAESEARFRNVADTAPAMLWITGVDLKTTFLSRGWYDYTGQAPDDALGFGWLPMIHPDDREETRRRYIEAAGRREPFNLDYRLRRADGRYRWVIDAGRPRFDAGGTFAGFVGSVIDVHERKEAEERQALLMREVDHRAKNALAVVQSVIRLTRADSPRDFVTSIEGRIGAIAHAHTLLAESSWTSASLRGLLERELAAYGLARIELSGEDVVLHPEAAQPFALAIHELATNAAKYGALSQPAGRLQLSWRQDEARSLRLTWRETGGPAVQPPTRLSFGSTLVGLAIRDQVGGTVEKTWHPQGLVCELLIPRTRVAVPSPLPRTVTAAASPAARVLVVEDDMLIALDIVEMLSRYGHDVVGPASGVAEALEVLANQQVDAAVLDANLGGAMATAIAERLDALKVPFVVATGYGTLPGAGFVGRPVMLSKPFTTDELRDALGAALARRAL